MKCGLDEAQTGIKTSGRNINNLRYANDTILMAEKKEELKSLFMKVKEESKKSWLKAQKTKIMASGPITSWQIDSETMTDFILGQKDGLLKKNFSLLLAPVTGKGPGCSLSSRVWDGHLLRVTVDL